MSLTPEQITALKENWEYDPIWDVEDDERLSPEQREEMRIYANAKRAEWAKARMRNEFTAMFKEPAFAAGGGSSFETEWSQSGMTIRQYYAGEMMQGLLASFGQHDVSDFASLASDAVRATDALIIALKREPEYRG